MGKVKLIVGYLCGQMLKVQGDIVRMQERLSELEMHLDKLYNKTCKDSSHNTADGAQATDKKVI